MVSSFIKRSTSYWLLVITAISCFLYASSVAAGKLLLVSTTSLENSGLYEYLLPKFTADTGIVPSVVAVGTGKAITIAKKGDADLLIVHDRRSELAFIDAGYGLDCTSFMYNQYVIVGSPENPAAINNDMTVSEVMHAIAGSRSAFISRGDDSGTHKKELSLWKMAGITPSAKAAWYYEVGRGMGTVLTMANELSAYTLSDYATWLSFSNRSNLIVLFDDKRYMYNPYSVILVNPKRHPTVNAKAATQFAEWLKGERGLSLIESFRVQGKQVFYPLRDAEQKPCHLEREV